MQSAFLVGISAGSPHIMRFSRDAIQFHWKIQTTLASIRADGGNAHKL